MAAAGDALPTVTDLLLARTDDPNTAILFETERWTWAEHVRECADRAAMLRSLRRPGPFHIGVLLDNVPEYSVLLGAAALSGAVVVALSTGRRGKDLVADIRRTDCQVVLTDSRYVEVLQGLDLGVRVLDIDSAAWHVSAFGYRDSRLDPAPVTADDPLLLLFTSGTMGEPKAVRSTHGDVTGHGRRVVDLFGVGPTDTAYLPVPLFHYGTLLAGWASAVAAGGTIALRRRFSASGFADDVREFGATYATYVGKSLSYVLSTTPQPGEANLPLRLMLGSEAVATDTTRFAERFGCRVIDTYGSTETGIALPARSDNNSDSDNNDRVDRPAGAVGRTADGLTVLDRDTAQPCPAATFGPDGQMTNLYQAVGEVAMAPAGTRPANRPIDYYTDPDQAAATPRDGLVSCGDLGYLDADGNCYIVGRAGDCMVVHDAHVAPWPIERILRRHPDVVDAAVYPVPDERDGNQVMAALVPRQGTAFDPVRFAAFLVEQEDLAADQWPRFVRLTARLPRTATYKVLRRALSAQRWRTPDPIWWRERPDAGFTELTQSSDPIRLDWGAGSVRR